jgi:hypothetical protein
MTSQVTPIEMEMFKRGYVSSRMAAVKLRKRYGSVLRQVSRRQFKALTIGRQRFISISSIREWYSEEARIALRLDDWSDVLYKDPEGNTHVADAI